MKKIIGGVTAPKGFTAAGIHCGIRKNKNKKDLALIVSSERAVASCVYTTNKVKGAPLTVTKNNISDGYASAVICNSGNANTCNPNGIEIAEKMCMLVEQHCSIDKKDIIVASTGVIGEKLDITPIENAMPLLFSALSLDGSSAAEAIMTTDTHPKERAYCFDINGTECRIGGIAKGSGMINPNMATLLAFITTDACISKEMLDSALSEAVSDTFNMISIDGDTSTNDMVSVLANGIAGNSPIDSFGNNFDIFKEALSLVCLELAKDIAADGEGATKLIECAVTGAADLITARTAAKSVISSDLVKTAMFGSDANWGRILCALGYSGADIDPMKIDVSFESANESVTVCKNGSATGFDEAAAKKILDGTHIKITVELNSGSFGATAYGCDLTYDYVKINGDYRT